MKKKQLVLENLNKKIINTYKKIKVSQTIYYYNNINIDFQVIFISIYLK